MRDSAAAARTDWRDLARDAADLALVGIAMTVAALPVVTAGAAVATASAAVHDRYARGQYPDVGTTLRRFLAAILPGFGAAVVAGLVAGLLAWDVAVLRHGSVPGGGPVLALTLAVVAALIGFAGLAVVAVGRQGGRGWRAALRVTARQGARRPLAVGSAAGVVFFAALLASAVPVTAPIVAGFALLALHAVARRLAPPADQ